MRKTATVVTSLALAAMTSLSAIQLRGSLSGVITDTTGRGMPGATLTATPEDGPAQRTVADSGGRYRFDGLAPGRYRIEVQMAGFDRKETEITVLSGRDAIWSGAVLVGPTLGAGSIERQVLRLAGAEARDCGRHSDAAPAAALEESLACALASTRAGEPFSVIVQFAGTDVDSGYGLLGGADGVARVFAYQRGGLRLRSEPCPSTQVTLSPNRSGTGFEYRCQAPVRRAVAFPARPTTP